VTDPNSPEIVTRLIAGNADAFEELYDLLAERLRLYVLRKHGRLVTYEDAEEVVNDAMHYAHSHIIEFNPAKRKLTTWIYGLVEKKLIDFLRRRSQKNRDALADPDPQVVLPLEELVYQDYPSEVQSGSSELSSSTAGIPKLSASEMEQLFNSLTEQERNVLKCSLSMKNKEIAKAFGLTPNNVGVIRHRAASKIRLALEKLKRS
jgi:RNA polymerase sigma factor (sigma-70 family)